MPDEVAINESVASQQPAASAERLVPAAEQANGRTVEQSASVTDQSASAAEEPAAPSPPRFNARQVGAARRFGFSDEDLVALEAIGRTGEALLERLAKADSDIGRRYSRLGREEQKGHGEEGAVVCRVSEAATVPDAAVAAAERRKPRHPADAEQGTAGNGAAVAPNAEVDRLRSQLAQLSSDAEQARLAAELAQAAAEQLRSEAEQAKADAQKAQAAQDAERAARDAADVERFFAALDAEVYPELAGGPSTPLGTSSSTALGTSPPAALAEDAPQRAARAQVAAKAEELRRGRQAVRGESMDVEESLRQALAVVAPEAPAAAERRRLARLFRRRSGGFTLPPSQRRAGGDLEAPEERTARALEEWQSRKGVRFFEE